MAMLNTIIHQTSMMLMLLKPHLGVIEVCRINIRELVMVMMSVVLLNSRIESIWRYDDMVQFVSVGTQIAAVG